MYMSYFISGEKGVLQQVPAAKLVGPASVPVWIFQIGAHPDAIGLATSFGCLLLKGSGHPWGLSPSFSPEPPTSMAALLLLHHPLVDFIH
jgi:hypothetical protein